MSKIIYLIFFTVVAGHVFAQHPSRQLSAFAFLPGSWKVMAKNKLPDQQGWETNYGRSVFTQTTGGVSLIENYVGTMRKNSFFETAIFAFDQFSNKFQRVFIDSEHGVLIDYEGEKKGDTLFFDRDWIYPNGSVVKLRIIYAFLTNDEFTTATLRMSQNMSNWDLVESKRYLRIK